MSDPSLATVWSRITAHSGQSFTLTRGQKFTYSMYGAYLLPDGRARRLSRTNFGNALDRLPLENTRSVADLQGSSYVYSILMDRRISQGDW